jgi:hypothetical protein
VGSRSARIALAPVLAAALAAAGCGSVDLGSPDDFRTEVNGICMQQAGESAQAQMRLGPATQKSEQATNQRAIAEVASGFDGDFSSVLVPDEVSGPYREFVEARQAVADLVETYAAALDVGYPARIVAARRKLDAGRQRQWAAAGELGLTDCDGKLSDAEREAAVGLVEELDTTSDPEKACSKLVFESYVESTFGSRAECARFQRKSSNRARSVDVIDVHGTDDVAAVVDFRDVDGPFEAKPLRATLFTGPDGGWLLWNVVELGS